MREQRLPIIRAAMKKAAAYQQAILLLDEYPIDGREEKPARAKELLEQAAALRPAHARTQAALGYACDLRGEAQQALACFREAQRLDPEDRIVEVYVLTLLAESGPEEEAVQAIRDAAPRHGVDLPALRRDLERAKFPSDAATLLRNGFIRARNFFRSRLADEAERIRNRSEPGRARRLASAEREACEEFQRELARSFDPSRVPDELRPLADWAARYGVGDDHCRPYLMKRLTRSQKDRLIRTMDEKADAVQRWLDRFAAGEFTDEAAAFMYLAEGVEEIRDIDGSKEKP
jgi:tetratricopeptide (TPR) repeat protein